MVGANAGAGVGDQLSTRQSGGMAIDDTPGRQGRLYFVEDVLPALQYSGDIHHFSQTQHVATGQERVHLAGTKRGPRVFPGGRGHA